MKIIQEFIYPPYLKIVPGILGAIGFEDSESHLFLKDLSANITEDT